MLQQGMLRMRFFRITQSLCVAVVASVVLFCGCSVKSGSPQPKSATGSVDKTATESGHEGHPEAKTGESATISATISAEGSSTVYPICQSFAVAFEKKTPHKVSVGRQGTGGGYKKFLNRQADIWNASRPIDPKESEELKSKGIEPFELTIAVDGIVIAVHPTNTWCSNLTCAQLKQIWEPDSKIKTWSDLDPAWPAQSILLFGADTDSGTFEYFTEVINGKKKATNTNYTPASDDNVLVQGIATNQNSLGYIPFGYYIENTEKLKAIAISPQKEATEPSGEFIEPSVDSILAGKYAPLSRPLFMYVDKASLKQPEVYQFLKFAVSVESQPLVEKRGFVRVNEETRENAAKTLDIAKEEVSVGP
jgi:phosphate transport system substrate-binding protein